MATTCEESVSVASPPQRSFGNALKWSYVMDGGRQAATTLVTFVLAGVLGPVAFGTVAMATVYILFVQMILQQGMIPALIQRRSLKPEHLDSAFWMIVGTSVVLTVLSMALSGWWASVNRLPDLRAVIVGLSILIPMKGLVLVQEGLLRREMDFRRLAVRTNASVVVGGAVGITMAFQGFGVWSLVGQQLTTGAVELVVLWTVSPWRPQLSFSMGCARGLLGFSAPSSLASFGVFVNNRSDALLIGLLFGPAAVGLYRFATRLVDMVIDTAVRSLQGVALPELSRLQDRREEFSARLLAMLRLSAILGLPALGVLSASSEAVMGMLGSEWAAASGPLKLLCLVGAVRALTFFNGPMLQAIGRPQHLAVLAWGAATLSAAAFVVAGLLLRHAPTGAQIFGISMSRVVLYGLLLFSVNIVILLRVTKLRVVQLAGAVAPAATAALAGMAAGQASQLLWVRWSPALVLAGTVVTAALTAGGVLLLTDSRCRSAVLGRWRDAPTSPLRDKAATDAATSL